MLDVQHLVSLHGCQLRSPLARVLETLGPPDQNAVSPPNPDGSVFVNYAWVRTTPALAVLTWRTTSGEVVWGIRALGPGPIVPELGFGGGSTRSDVGACLPDSIDTGAGPIKLPLLDGTLTINFSGDLVDEIQLLAPMTPSH
jgi:hypothetical protein